MKKILYAAVALATVAPPSRRRLSRAMTAATSAKRAAMSAKTAANCVTTDATRAGMGW